MKLHRGKAADRAGYALVLFVLIFVGLMGLAALVIDMGFARLAQRQMQTAVDSAALEGLRWRDVAQSGDLPPAWFDSPDFQEQTGVVLSTGSLSSQQRDAVRRWAASQIVANTFASDLNSDPASYGAGPVAQFQGGNSTLPTASQQLIVPASPVYQPTRSDGTPGLEMNVGNAQQSGDMSSGTYGANPNYDPTQSADEDGGYNRRDLTPSSGTAASASDPAFLVRMRRTNNSEGLDREPGVSSGGPTLPVLFGRGSLMAQSGGTGQLSVASGITVRGTAVAAAGDNIQFGGTSYSAGRAKTAGSPPTDPNTGNPVGIPGITPFALSWSGQTSFQVASDGSIPGGGQVIQPALVEIGQQIGKSVTGQNAAWLSQYVSSHGTNAAGYTGPTLLALSQYVPVVDANNTIIGFGYVQSWTWTAMRNRRWHFEYHDGSRRVCGLWQRVWRPCPWIDARHN